MAENCKNCNEIISENFCSNCGQKKFKRIDRKYVFDEIQYTVFHTNKGLLYSLKNILKNPGKTARNFIDGDRVNHYKPILLVFVLSGISTFISYKILDVKDIMIKYFNQNHMNSNFMSDIMSTLSSYATIFMLLLIPIFALTTRLAFKNWGHNYYEHIVMNSFILSYYTLLNVLIVYPILFFLKHDVNLYLTVSQASILIIIYVLIRFFKGFYPDKTLKSIILRSFFAMALVFVGYILTVIIVTIIGLLFAMITNPNSIQEYMKTR